MARLELSLLGTFRAILDGEPVTTFEYDKVRALLAYLAVESDRSQRRETLAGLLWPERPEQSARQNLSQALFSLRRAIGDRQATPPFLLINHWSLQFNRSSDYWLDVMAFTALLDACDQHRHRRLEDCDPCKERLQRATALYRGSFLKGFSLGDCPAFEEWAVLTRERLHRLAMEALHRLAYCHERRGECKAGLQHAWRQVDLDPWREVAHRQVMRLLALSGQRGAALAQYETCRRLLAEELGVEPAAETIELYEQIRDGELKIPVSPAAQPLGSLPRPPAFLDEEGPVETDRPVFVARERELAQLNAFLNQALAGQGQVIFITAEAGAGKTALVQEFARQAQDAHPDLIVASGKCNAYTGIGDPYHPFRAVMGLLTGDIQSRWAAGAISRERAHRLWRTLPYTVQALIQDGPDLIDTFIAGPALIERARAYAPGEAGWLTRLGELVLRRPAPEGAADLEQSGLFEQYTRVMHRLAQHTPILLVLDDLQWADAGSINLLFHIGRRLGRNRILIVGAYRPEEVASGRDGKHHPLEPVVSEFRRDYGDIIVRVGQTGGWEFVSALLESKPNRLGTSFRETLYRQTRGHALFTVELLRDMQERGDLVQDESGRWVEGLALDWGTLPARVEAVIEARIGRLEGRLRDILTAASVEGERFTAQVVAEVLDIPVREVARALSQELGACHRLVREGEEVQVDQRFLSRYRFAHALFQGYLYHALSTGERRLLHGEIAQALEALYGGQSQGIAVQLARHYAEAGESERAVEYLLQAGDKARARYAHQEAIDCYRRSLALLREQGDYEGAARTLMKLGLAHHMAFDFDRARGVYDEGFSLWQRAVAVQPAVLPPAPHALRIRTWDPVTLDPTLARDMASVRFTEQLFSGLAELTPEMDVVPDVARTWEVSKGGRRYAFHLRDDAFWSDGTPLTAADFEYAWKRTLDPTVGSPNASLLYDIQGARDLHQGRATDPDRVGVRAVDAVTLIVELEEPTGYFPHLVASWATYPIPRHIVEMHGEAWTEVENIVTNGPFRLEVWRQGESMVLSRNPQYHGQFTGNLRRVELSLISSSEWSSKSEIEMYRTDKLDVALIEWETVYMRREQAEEYISAPRLMTLYLGFDTSRPPFNDVRVRRAFVLATDRETLANVVLKGYQSPATGGFVPPGMPGHSPGIGLPYDPDQARQLLAEAGYSKSGSHGFPVVEALIPRGRMPHSEYLQAQWRENLGIEIEWESLEYGRFLDRLNKEPPHMFRAGWWAEYPDPDNFLRTSTVRSETRWRNAAYDRLMEQVRRLVAQEERMKVYRQADRILVEEAPIMPLAYMRWNLLVKPWVRRYLTSLVGKRFNKDVIIEPH